MTRAAAVVVVLTVLAGACSSTNDETPTLDSSQRLVTLSDTRRGALCDWYAQRAGGYRRTIPRAGRRAEKHEHGAAIYLLLPRSRTEEDSSAAYPEPALSYVGSVATRWSLNRSRFGLTHSPIPRLR